MAWDHGLSRAVLGVYARGARAWAPPYWGQESATFMSVNRNKRSLAVDLNSREGLAIVERLVARADVFVQSLRAGSVEELGLGWEQARALNPRCGIGSWGGLLGRTASESGR